MNNGKLSVTRRLAPMLAAAALIVLTVAAAPYAQRKGAGRQAGGGQASETQRLSRPPAPKWYPSFEAPKGMNFVYIAGHAFHENEDEAKKAAESVAMQRALDVVGASRFKEDGGRVYIDGSSHPPRPVDVVSIRRVREGGKRGYDVYVLFKIKDNANRADDHLGGEGRGEIYMVEKYHDLVHQYNLDFEEHERNRRVQARQDSIKTAEAQKAEAKAAAKVAAAAEKEIADKARRDSLTAAYEVYRDAAKWISFGIGTGYMPHGSAESYSGSVTGLFGGYVSGRYGSTWARASKRTWGVGGVFGIGNGSRGELRLAGGVNIYPFDNYYVQTGYGTAMWSSKSDPVIQDGYFESPKVTWDGGLHLMAGRDFNTRILQLSVAGGVAKPDSKDFIVPVYSVSAGFKINYAGSPPKKSKKGGKGDKKGGFESSPQKQGDASVAVAPIAGSQNPVVAALRHMETGDTYYEREEYVNAIESYSQAIKLEPKNADFYNKRGDAYWFIDYYDLAIKDYTQAIKLNPKFAQAYLGRGIAYTDKGDYSRAIIDYNQALKLGANNIDIYFNRGYAYLENDKYDLAIEDFTKVIQLDANYADAYYFRGIAYSRELDGAMAIADFEEALRIDPNHARAKEALESLR